jgi:hypothetical protein
MNYSYFVLELQFLEQRCLSTPGPAEAFSDIHAALEQGQIEFNQLRQHVRIHMLNELVKEACLELECTDRYSRVLSMMHEAPWMLRTCICEKI